MEDTKKIEVRKASGREKPGMRPREHGQREKIDGKENRGEEKEAERQKNKMGETGKKKG